MESAPKSRSARDANKDGGLADFRRNRKVILGIAEEEDESSDYLKRSLGRRNSCSSFTTQAFEWLHKTRKIAREHKEMRERMPAKKTR